jgi:sec-independent protein translocase protein TatB
MAAPLEVDLGVLGWADSLILMVLALVVFGPRRLPQIGRQIGKLMYEFRKASNDFKFQMEEELRSAEEADRRKKEDERRAALALQAPPAPTPAESPGSSYGEGAADQQTRTTGESEPAATVTDETSLRVQPPSTGEQVAASRPGATASDVAASGLDALSDLAAKNGAHHDSASTEAAAGHAATAEPAQPAVEQETHHA